MATKSPLRAQLDEKVSENTRLRNENASLRNQLSQPVEAAPAPSNTGRFIGGVVVGVVVTLLLVWIF